MLRHMKTAVCVSALTMGLCGLALAHEHGGALDPRQHGYEHGYRDGLDAARKDLRKNRDFRPEKYHHYEDASHGYRESYGDKNEYKRRYREGFLRGYDDAYGPGLH